MRKRLLPQAGEVPESVIPREEQSGESALSDFRRNAPVSTCGELQYLQAYSGVNGKE